MFVSAWNFLTKYLPVFAYTFQSRYLRSSPGVYLRCSENLTENPWNGLACSPVRNPSTMNFARRSSRATWAITSGRRYFSAEAIGKRINHRVTEGTEGRNTEEARGEEFRSP